MCVEYVWGVCVGVRACVCACCIGKCMLYEPHVVVKSEQHDNKANYSYYGYNLQTMNEYTTKSFSNVLKSKMGNFRSYCKHIFCHIISVKDKVKNETTTATTCANSVLLPAVLHATTGNRYANNQLLMHDRCTCATTTTRTVKKAKINSRIKKIKK